MTTVRLHDADTETPAGIGQRTKHFGTVFGVFQGGGVRGAALAGAFASARARGVHFGAVAGTSAGAIVAALIAAGADAAFLRNALTQLDMMDLLTPSTELSWLQGVSRLVRVPAALLSHIRWLGITKEHVRVLHFGGMYSADALEDWIATQLRLLTGSSRTVRFRDLVLPLYVVAADAHHKRAKVWSHVDDADMSVARAARHSASIPVFFQPQRDQDGLYVDGGSLSNLPAFVYRLPAAQSALRSVSSRILAFGLTSEEPAVFPTSVASYARALADTFVDGNVDLQLQMQEHVALVRLPTGTIQATDFRLTVEQRMTLWDNGWTATDTFLDHESVYMKPTIRGEYDGFEEQMLLFTSALASGRPSQVTTVGDTSYVFYAMPALLHATEDAITVDVVCDVHTTDLPEAAAPARHRDARWEAHRRTLLVGMGAVVHEVPWARAVPSTSETPSEVTTPRVSGIPWEGMLIRYASRDRRAIVLGAATQFGDDATFLSRKVVVYSDPLDATVLDALERDVASIRTPQSTRPAPAPVQWRRCDTTEWGQLFRLIPQYSAHTVTLAVGDVALADVYVLDRFIKEYRLPSVRRLIAGYRARETPLFEPVWAALSNGHKSLVTPPVFEIAVDGSVTAVEGVTRCFVLAEEGAMSVRGIIVRNVEAPLPGTRRPLAHVRTTSRTLGIADNIENYNSAFLRQIETAVHPFPVGTMP